MEKGSVTRVSPGSGATGAAGLADHGLRVHRQAAGQRANSPRQHDRRGQGHAGSDFTLKVTGDATDDAVIETQDPAAGTQVDKGSTISVTAKKPPPRIPATTATTATAARRQVGTEPPGMAVVAIAV